MYEFLTRAHTDLIISGEFAAERLSSVSSAGAKSWRTQI